jgi:hypothetical protein
MNEYIHPNGYTYTEDELISAAKNENMTLEEFVSNRGIKPKKSKAPGKPKTVVKEDAVATAKSTASKSAAPSSVSPDNPFGKPKTIDPLGLEKLRTAPATKPAKVTAPTGQGYKYDSRGYLVPKDTKEPSLWDDVKDFARNLFPDSEEDNNGKLTYYEQTPIKTACDRNDVKMVKILIPYMKHNNGFNKQINKLDCCSPCLLSCGNETIAKLILENKIEDVNKTIILLNIKQKIIITRMR